MQEIVSEKILLNFIRHEIDSNQDLFERLYGLQMKLIAEFTQSKGDPGKVVVIAHKLKSSCKTFGAVRLETVLEQIESAKNSATIKIDPVLLDEALTLLPVTMETIRKVADSVFGRKQDSA